MATSVQYKKPRRINLVSVTLVLIVVMAGYATYLYLPLYLMQHEAYRVLEETGSKIAGRPVYYMDDSVARDGLRKKMQTRIQEVGVNDPNLETWIEFEGKEARIGVFYSVPVHWPFGVLPSREAEYELQHTLVVH